MKKLIFFLFLLAGQTFAQDAQIIKTDFESMIKYTRQKNMDKIFDMTYPKLFEVMPKAQMKALAVGALEGMGIKTIYEENPINLKLSKIEKLSNSTICLGQYDQNMIMEFGDKTLTDLFQNAGTKGYKVEKLSDRKLKMSGTTYLLAIKDSHTKNTWKYLTYDDQSIDNNQSILSPNIVKAANQLKLNFANTR